MQVKKVQKGIHVKYRLYINSFKNLFNKLMNTGTWQYELGGHFFLLKTGKEILMPCAKNVHQYRTDTFYHLTVVFEQQGRCIGFQHYRQH